MSILQTRQLQVAIAGKVVCRQLDLCIEAGEVWGVMGRNGVGKTTLLHSLAGLTAVESGDILLRQKPLHQYSRRQLAQKVGILLQHHEDAFPVSVLDTVLSGRHPHIDSWHWESAKDYAIAREALQTVDMQDMAQRPIDQLSGGERQRVAIATLLSQQPEIYLLDEPNSHLDLNYQISILQHLVDHARSSRCSMIMSLHDINLAARFCTHILYLHGNGDTDSGSVDEQLQNQKLQAVFGHPINSSQVNGRRVFWAE